MSRTSARPPSTGPALALVTALAVTSLSAPAQALLRPGDPRPGGSATATDGTPLRLAALAGQTVVIFYEDKDSTQLNTPLKQAIRRWKGERAEGARVRLLPVADVSGFNWWPAKGFARNAIAKQAREIGLQIYCDWDGSFGKALSATKGTSNVVVLGPDGRVRFSHAGALPAQRIPEVLGKL